MKNRKGWKKFIFICLAVTLLIPVLAACSKNAAPADDTPRTLRIASTGYIGENGEYMREYTELFEYEYKNIELEYIQTMDESRYYNTMPVPEEEQVDPLEKLKEVMNGPTPPDVVMIDYSQLQSLVNDNLLVPLDEMMLEEENFNVEDFVPAVIDGLRKPGNGQLYALAPMFYSSAVIYNKDLFLQQAVEFPHDNMTWQEMFDLARRVTVVDDENPVFGFSFNNWYGGMWDLFYTMNTYTAPLGLKWIDEETLQMTANTPTWQDVWRTFVDLYKEGVLPQEPDYSQPRNGPFDYDVFLSGKAAMTIVPYSYLNEVISANNSADRIENFEPIDWDVVAMPTHPEAPGVGANISYQGIFAINANAENMDDAWEFIKFINGEDYARLKSKSSYNLVSRQSYIQPREGIDYNLNAFLMLSPPEFLSNEMVLYEKLPDYWSVQNIGQNKLIEVINNDKDISLALQEWETEGQMMIQQLLEQRDNPDGGMSIEEQMLRQAAGELYIEDSATEEVFEEEFVDEALSGEESSDEGVADEAIEDIIVE